MGTYCRLSSRHDLSPHPLTLHVSIMRKSLPSSRTLPAPVPEDETPQPAESRERSRRAYESLLAARHDVGSGATWLAFTFCDAYAGSGIDSGSSSYFFRMAYPLHLDCSRLTR